MCCHTSSVHCQEPRRCTFLYLQNFIWKAFASKQIPLDTGAWDILCKNEIGDPDSKGDNVSFGIKITETC